MNPAKATVTTVIAAIAIIVVVIVLLAAITVVPAGHVGVVVLFGKVRATELQPGMHIINPLANVVKMETRLMEYTMSVSTGEGAQRSDDAIDALTSEGLKVRLDLTAWYRLNPQDAANVYSDIGTNFDKKIIRPTLRTAIRDIVVKYTANSIYSEKRDSVVLEINNRAKELMGDRGITLDRILLRNVILPQKIADAIDAKLAADQDAQRMEFVLEKERMEKERKIVEAEGIREANRIIAQGLTSSYIQWYRIEMLKQLVNSPNNTIVILPEDMQTSPLMLNTR